jgi:hypothetical protein
VVNNAAMDQDIVQALWFPSSVSFHEHSKPIFTLTLYLSEHAGDVWERANNAMLVRIAGSNYHSSTVTLYLSVFEGLNAIHKTPCVKIMFMTLVAAILSTHSDNSHSKLRRDNSCLSCNPRLVLPVLYIYPFFCNSQMRYVKRAN